jgi:hypothetical protein
VYTVYSTVVGVEGDGELTASLSYIVSSRPAWATQDCLTNKNKAKDGTRTIQF